MFAMVLLAVIPSCKKCYTCTIPAVYNCVVSGSVYTTFPDNSSTSQTACTQDGGTLVLATSGSSSKHCYNTSGPTGGALNGQASAESADEDACLANSGATWTPN
jgi:hypothetical protein